MLPRFDWTPEETAQIALGLISDYRVVCWTEEPDPQDCRHVNTIIFHAPGDEAAKRYIAQSIHAFRFSVGQIDPEATEFSLDLIRVIDNGFASVDVERTFYTTRQRA